MKKILLTIMLGIVLISFASAETNLGTFKQGDCIEIYQYCDTCTYVNLTQIQYPNGTIVIINSEMTKDDTNYNYTFCDTTTLGTYYYSVKGDRDAEISVERLSFEITYDGKEFTIQKVHIQLFIVLFFILLFFGFYFLKSRVDLEKLNNSIIKKYENKNYVKLVFSSLIYNVLKNSFVIYYLLGFLVLTTITNLVYLYNFEELITLFETIIIVYTIGIVLVGLLFLSYVQEWFMDLLDKVTNMDWGVEK